MTYKRFEDLPVWNLAIDLAVGVFALSEAQPLRRYSDIRDHLERASVSISNNIAEGFERGTTAELLAFLYIARGSAGEVRSLLCLMERLPALVTLRDELFELKLQVTRVSRQIGAWAESLKNSDAVGARHFDKRKKQEVEMIRRRDAFLEKMKEVQARKGVAQEDESRPES